MKGRITDEEFVYDAEADAYRCPNDKLLKPTEGCKINTGGRVEIRYVSRKADCDGCPLRARCVTEKTPTRTVQRWEHEDVLLSYSSLRFRRAIGCSTHAVQSSCTDIFLPRCRPCAACDRRLGEQS
jgi:hypothetical protein